MVTDRRDSLSVHTNAHAAMVAGASPVAAAALISGASSRRPPVTTIRRPVYATLIDGPRGVRGDRRQSRRTPVLPASGASPVTARLDRALGELRGHV